MRWGQRRRLLAVTGKGPCSDTYGNAGPGAPEAAGEVVIPGCSRLCCGVRI